MRRLLLVLLLMLAITDRAAAQTPLELVPEDAVVSISIRDLNALIKKGDKFLQDTDIRMPLRPSELFDEGAKWVGVNQGFDRTASAAISLMRPEKKEDANNWRWLDTSLVAILPFTDADVMAGNFAIPKGKLKPNEILMLNDRNNFGKHIMRSNKHIFLGGGENSHALKQIQKSKTVSAALTPAQRLTFDRSDILVHFGSYLFETNEDIIGPEFADRMRVGDDPREKEFAQQFAKSLKEVKNTVMGFEVLDGINAHLLMTVPKGGQASKLFGSLREKVKPATLNGLPEGNVLLAQAFAGKADQHAMLAKVFFNLLLEDFLISHNLVHNVDRLTYLGVFNEVWRQMQSNRTAVYQNLDEKKHGLFCAVAILDIEDAKFFIQGMRLLTNMASADKLDLTKKEVKEEIDLPRLVRDLGSAVYPTRQSATTKITLIGEPALPYLAKAIESIDFDLEGKRRARDLRDRINVTAAQRRKELLDATSRPLLHRPKMTFVANIEKREDVSVDIISLKIEGLDKVATQQITQLLGPDWDKIRLAIVGGNQIVVMLGSDVALFEAALRNLKKGDPGLANSKRLAGFNEIGAKDRQFEFHVSIEAVLRLVAANAKLDTPTQMTSVSLTLNEQSLQLDVRVPTAEVRTIAKKAQERFQ